MVEALANDNKETYNKIKKDFQEFVDSSLVKKPTELIKEVNEFLSMRNSSVECQIMKTDVKYILLTYHSFPFKEFDLSSLREIIENGFLLPLDSQILINFVATVFMRNKIGKEIIRFIDS